MLVRVVTVGDGLAGLSLEDFAPEGDFAVEHRSAEPFWADPGNLPFDLAVVSYSDLPRDPAPAIRRLRALAGKPEVAVLGIDIEAPETLTLQAAGCYAVVPAGLGEGRLAKVLGKLVSRRRDALEVAARARQAPEPPRVDDFVSASPAMQSVLRIARRVARSDTSLLLLGETGVGKEWLAQAVHVDSPRAAGPFIAVNSGAIPETLLESELFGHEEGAFTGAVRARRGYFEQAHGGTLFLDEIGDMPLHLQSRLLRVLQDGTVQRIGSEKSLQVDTRVIAATHRDLMAAIESGKFRLDLYYRLAVVTLTLPALRERVEDVPQLVEASLHKLVRKLRRPQLGAVTPAAMAALTAYRWPGNVRELINVLERAVLLCDGAEIDLVDLPAEIASPDATAARQAGGKKSDDLEAWIDQPVAAGRLAAVADFERRYFARLLERHRGRIGATARHAGVDPRTVYNKLRQLGLHKDDYRN
jgi:two-component system, NtrC family, response regulator AtoC